MTWWILKHWKWVVMATLIIVVVSAWQIHGERAYQRGYAAATTKISADLAKVEAKRIAEAQAKEHAANQALYTAQINLEKERHNAKKSINALRIELDRVQQRAALERAKLMSQTTHATSTSDGEDAAAGWQLFGECSSKYAKLAEIADEQNADLHEWQAYGMVVQNQYSKH